MTLLLQSVGSGLLESVSQAAVVAATLLLALMVVALGGFAYRSLRGDGIRWPDEDDADGVTRSEDDDEWKYH